MTTDPALPAELTATRLTIDDGGVAWVTLHRPEAANARNQRMRDELRDIYAYLRQQDRVRAVVLTGAGDRFFCAGMDLKESAAAERILERRERLRRSRDIELLAALPMPTIAAVNGYALGGGCEMALACDLRVVAEEAQIGLPELTHGLVPGGGGTQRLPRLIGQARTLELLFLGRRLTGREAAGIGLASMCVTRAELLPAVTELAQRIAALPPVAVRYAKELVRRSLETPLQAGLDLELDALLALLGNGALPHEACSRMCRGQRAALTRGLRARYRSSGASCPQPADSTCLCNGGRRPCGAAFHHAPCRHHRPISRPGWTCARTAPPGGA